MTPRHTVLAIAWGLSMSQQTYDVASRSGNLNQWGLTWFYPFAMAVITVSYAVWLGVGRALRYLGVGILSVMLLYQFHSGFTLSYRQPDGAQEVPKTFHHVGRRRWQAPLRVGGGKRNCPAVTGREIPETVVRRHRQGADRPSRGHRRESASGQRCNRGRADDDSLLGAMQRWRQGVRSGDALDSRSREDDARNRHTAEIRREKSPI